MPFANWPIGQAAIIVVHHCKKSSDVASAPLERVIGSIGITGTAETILVMEQQTGSKDCKLHVTGKDVEQCEKYLSWNGHGFEIGDDVREAQLGSIQKVVLMLIRESPRCMQKHIVDTTGKDQGQISKAIDKLVEVGLVVRTEGRLMAQQLSYLSYLSYFVSKYDTYDRYDSG